MEFVQREGRGQTPNPNFFGVHFGSIEIIIWRHSWAIDTYFWIQTSGGKRGSTKSLDEIHTFIFFFG
jgi:hypothetical protein